ncbi:uncharacterized protein G2W53_006015 [Senna tora]|uniref:Retrotransposon Copia-like N-terminal domain-containing protein n=1 Tax=Senna tora TaxID=362788 RepID=A0A834X2Z4_9FABA|nr:uncharacterized protein G2W53_006015 [Senna tora]
MSQGSSATGSAGNGSEGSGSGSRAGVATDMNYRKDPFYLHPSDTSGVQLIPNQLTQENYMVWKRSMMIALKTKNKLGFVDGSILQPADRKSDEYLIWSFVDSAVIGWLLHSMNKELHEAFMFTPTARQIWKELEEKYGQCNRPQLLHVKKMLANLERVNKAYDQIQESNYVHQFLMGLGEAYENVVDNVLLMEPIPSYNKVYAMVARVERQMSISSQAAVEANALLAKAVDQKINVASGGRFSSYDRKKEKASKYCTTCNKTGHTEESCFKKTGVPDWYKELKLQRGKKTGENVYAVFNENNAGEKQKIDREDRKVMTELIQEEIKRMMAGKATGVSGGDTTSSPSPVNASYFADFAGNIVLTHHDFFNSDSYDKTKVKWIVDSGASCHVTGDLRLLKDVTRPKGKNTVQLPDGVIKEVELMGQVQLKSGLTLLNVLFVPDFKYNLISEFQYLISSDINVVLFTSHYEISEEEMNAITNVKEVITLTNRDTTAANIQNWRQEIVDTIRIGGNSMSRNNAYHES